MYASGCAALAPPSFQILKPHSRCRANLGPTRQSRPVDGLGFQANVLTTFQGVPCLLNSGLLWFHLHVPSRSRNLTPYTRRPAPYILHLTPHTPHPTPHTLQSTLCTQRPTPYILHPTLYALHTKPYTLTPWPASERLWYNLANAPYCRERYVLTAYWSESTLAS